MAKLNDCFIECDSCTIRIGPSRHCHDFNDIGLYKICDWCADKLANNGYVVINHGDDEDEDIILLLWNGLTKTVDLKTLLKLQTNQIVVEEI